MREKNQEQRAQNHPGHTIYSYRNLIVWQKAQELAEKVIRIARSLPRNADTQVISYQIIRSATSIGANIAEGYGRFTPAAHKNYLSIAKASASETGSWLDLLLRLDYIDSETEAKLNADAEEISRILVARMRQIDKLASEQKRSGQIAEEAPLYITDDEPLSGWVLGSES